MRTMLTYPFTLVPDTNGTLLVTFPDVPEAITVANDLPDAHAQAREALEAALVLYRSLNRRVPRPSRAKKGQGVVTIPSFV
ncbi:type II toxin-antitoxin system HicB family antitoxin [Pandoraea pneumonica]|uniref:type II toxin-antitoxin system HicB family antitoxin n=1 Tax=Pandoraea pneumonica TaxID=2508299 RepID=UPI003CFA72BB